MKFMGMITIGWSLKQRHQRQASIMSLYFNLPFAAIALIFLMGCSLGKFSFLILPLGFLHESHEQAQLLLETQSVNMVM